MGWLGAVGRVDLATDLDFQVLEAGPVFREEEPVEDVAAGGLGIVDEQARGRAGTHGADALELALGAGWIKG